MRIDRVTQEHIKTAADRRAAADGCRFKPELGGHVEKFFKTYLRHSKGKWAGSPFTLQPWQLDDVIMPLFSWVRSDGSRRFNRAFVMVPKKQGKSTTAAGIGLYLLCGDGEPGAEVYSVGTDRDSASIVHSEAIQMVESSPQLRNALRINRTTKHIFDSSSNSYYKALSSDAPSAEGLNISGAIIDELHAWRDRRLWDALRYGFAARRQPLLFTITTAGSDVESICHEQYELAKAITDGTNEDDSLFAYIRAADPSDDWTNPATWRKANPSMGVTVAESEFAQSVEEARRSPASENAFKRYRLNIWCTSETPWMSLDAWTACCDSFTENDLFGQECYAGLDLSKTSDMTALVLVFRSHIDDTYRVFPYFWLPEETATRNKHLTTYAIWAQRGHVELTPGSVCDYAFIHRRLCELRDKFQIRKVIYDPYNASHIVQQLQDDGFECIQFGQTMTNFAPITAEFERLVLAGKLRHNGHPVLNWQIGHVQVRTDANQNKRPIKPKDHRKIDGVVAALMALALASKLKESVYERREMILL